MLELTQEFYFEAAHTLSRQLAPGHAPAEAREKTRESSLRVHGHTYHADVTVRGERDPATGMVVDLATLKAHIETVRQRLDHRMLNDVPGLGKPTLENLVLYIATQLRELEPRVSAVRVYRKASGDSCLLRL